MNDNFDNTRVRLRGTMNRMLRMAERTGVGWRVWMMFILAVMGLFSWVWLFWCWIDIGCLVCWRNVGMGLGLFFFRGRSERRERVDGLLGWGAVGKASAGGKDKKMNYEECVWFLGSDAWFGPAAVVEDWIPESDSFFFFLKKSGGGPVGEKKTPPLSPGERAALQLWSISSFRQGDGRRKEKEKKN